MTAKVRRLGVAARGSLLAGPRPVSPRAALIERHGAPSRYHMAAIMVRLDTDLHDHALYN